MLVKQPAVKSPKSVEQRPPKTPAYPQGNAPKSRDIYLVYDKDFCEKQRCAKSLAVFP
jgi:hypothetical protein